jgi:hypothetical protein
MLLLQHCGVDEERKPGRPRKWSSDAERMRAYRDRQRDRSARLTDQHTSEALADGQLRRGAHTSSRSRRSLSIPAAVALACP